MCPRIKFSANWFQCCGKSIKAVHKFCIALLWSIFLTVFCVKQHRQAEAMLQGPKRHLLALKKDVHSFFFFFSPPPCLSALAKKATHKQPNRQKQAVTNTFLSHVLHGLHMCSPAVFAQTFFKWLLDGFPICILLTYL